MSIKILVPHYNYILKEKQFLLSNNLFTNYDQKVNIYINLNKIKRNIYYHLSISIFISCLKIVLKIKLV